LLGQKDIKFVCECRYRAETDLSGLELGRIQVAVSRFKNPELIVTNERNFRTAHTTVGCRIMESLWLALRTLEKNTQEEHFQVKSSTIQGPKSVFSKPLSPQDTEQMLC
jgi:hypothetical protein